jgi:DNA-binding transcriptional MerR regulator
LAKNLIDIKEAAKFLGISPATVNYYTSLKFFTVAERKGNKRLYDKADIGQKYECVRELRRQGFPLSIIHRKICAPEHDGQGGSQ